MFFVVQKGTSSSYSDFWVKVRGALVCFFSGPSSLFGHHQKKLQLATYNHTSSAVACPHLFFIRDLHTTSLLFVNHGDFEDPERHVNFSGIFINLESLWSQELPKTVYSVISCKIYQMNFGQRDQNPKMPRGSLSKDTGNFSWICNSYSKR